MDHWQLLLFKQTCSKSADEGFVNNYSDLLERPSLSVFRQWGCTWGTRILWKSTVFCVLSATIWLRGSYTARTLVVFPRSYPYCRFRQNDDRRWPRHGGKVWCETSWGGVGLSLVSSEPEIINVTPYSLAYNVSLDYSKNKQKPFSRNTWTPCTTRTGLFGRVRKITIHVNCKKIQLQRRIFTILICCLF